LKKTLRDSAGVAYVFDETPTLLSQHSEREIACGEGPFLKRLGVRLCRMPMGLMERWKLTGDIGFGGRRIDGFSSVAGGASDASAAGGTDD